MKQTELLFLQALAEILHPNAPHSELPFRTALWQDSASELLSIARQQKMLPPIYEFLCQHNIEISREQMPALTTEIATYVFSCQQMEYFTKYICKIFDDAKIPYALLKGTVLSALYPKPEYRRFGDVDLLVNDKKEFLRAVTILKAHDFRQVPSGSNHHFEFELTRHGHTYILELHQSITYINDNIALYDKINALFDNIPLDQPLSATLEALYLLLHMLKHLLSFGFGIKLLCDWIVYLEAHTPDIDNAQFQQILNSLDLSRFAISITAFCKEYLGLNACPDCLSYKFASSSTKDILELLAEDIFTGGEYGYSDTTRSVIMKSNSHFTGYFQELHRQTKRNFPVAGRVLPILPFLWLATGIRFLYNNRHIRHVSTRDMISTEKKRQQLVKALKIKL